MSASGYTPPRSETTASSEAATSSSHQPTAKSLRVLEAVSGEGSSPRLFNSPTDGEEVKEQEDAVPVLATPVLSPRRAQSAQPVPHARQPKEQEAHTEEHHEADDFVPRADRTQTLEKNVVEVFEIGSEEEEDMTKKKG